MQTMENLDGNLLRGLEAIATYAGLNSAEVRDLIGHDDFPAVKRDGTRTGSGPWYSTKPAIREWWDMRLKLGRGGLG